MFFNFWFTVFLPRHSCWFAKRDQAGYTMYGWIISFITLSLPWLVTWRLPLAGHKKSVWHQKPSWHGRDLPKMQFNKKYYLKYPKSRRLWTLLVTGHIEHNIFELIPRLQMTVLLNEICEWQVHMILVWVRVLHSSLQVIDGLGADLEVLLCNMEIKTILT